MNNIRPISPDEIIKDLVNIIPHVAILAVNNLLKKKYRGVGPVIITQKEIINEIRSLDPNLTTQIIYDEKYLDFEEVYRQHGWKVTYDKPGFNENGEPLFEFEPKK